MNQRRIKRQHYVPRPYRLYFADAVDLIWTCDKREDVRRSGTIEDTAVQTNFYSLADASAEYANVLEAELSEVENDAASLYRKLLNGELPEGQGKAELAVFFSSLLMRRPVMVRASAQMTGLMA